MKINFKRVEEFQKTVDNKRPGHFKYLQYVFRSKTKIVTFVTPNADDPKSIYLYNDMSVKEKDNCILITGGKIFKPEPMTNEEILFAVDSINDPMFNPLVYKYGQADIVLVSSSSIICKQDGELIHIAYIIGPLTDDIRENGKLVPPTYKRNIRNYPLDILMYANPNAVIYEKDNIRVIPMNEGYDDYLTYYIPATYSESKSSRVIANDIRRTSLVLASKFIGENINLNNGFEKFTLRDMVPLIDDNRATFYGYDIPIEDLNLDREKDSKLIRCLNEKFITAINFGQRVGGRFVHVPVAAIRNGDWWYSLEDEELIDDVLDFIDMVNYAGKKAMTDVRKSILTNCGVEELTKFNDHPCNKCIIGLFSTLSD